MRKSGGKCYDLLFFGWWLGWLGGFFELGLCRMRPCVGVAQEVLSIKCQQEQGGPGPAKLHLLWCAPKAGDQEWEFSLVPVGYPGWSRAGLVLLMCGPIRLFVLSVSFAQPSLVKPPSSSVLVVTGAV